MKNTQRSVHSTARTRCAAVVVAFVLLAAGRICFARDGLWTMRADMPVLTVPAVAAVDGKIYVIGGTRHTGDGPLLSTLYEYGPGHDIWLSKPDMPTARYDHAAVVVDGRVYVTGGSATVGHSTKAIAVVEVYDPATQTWTRAADMPEPRGGHCASVVDGRIYVLGGYRPGDWSATNTVQEYDPLTDTWRQKADMPRRRHFFAAATVDGILYAIGGISGVDAYDPGTDAWTSRAPLLHRNYSMAAGVIDGKILVVGGAGGGFGDADPQSRVEVYDPLTDTWEARAPMPMNIAMSANTAVVDGMLFVMGGAVAGAGVGAGGRSTLLTYEPDRSHLLQSAPPDPLVLAGAEVPLALTLREPNDGIFPELLVDLSPSGERRVVGLTHQGAGRYEGTITAPPTSGRFRVPVRMAAGAGHLPLHLTSIDLSVWPGGPLEILSEGLAPGWETRVSYLKDVALAQSGTVCTGGTACAVQTKSSFAGWNLRLQAEAPVHPFGYESLHLAIHPGDLAPGDKDRMTLGLGGGTESISLVDEGLIDWSRKEWQELDIPLSDFALEGPITEVQFSGKPVGTFYVDDLMLVAGPAPLPPTAVVETRTEALPGAFSLRQNYPNPFNSHTLIGFDLPAAADVDLGLYDLLGQRVATMVRGHRRAGTYTLQWDGRDDGGQPLASGLYLYRLQSAHQTETRKLLLVR